MRRTNIYLGERQCEAIDRLAREDGVSRAELVRAAIDQWLAARGDDEAADLEAIESSFGALRDSTSPR